MLQKPTIDSRENFAEMVENDSLPVVAGWILITGKIKRNTYYSLYPVMINGVRTIYLRGLNKEFVSKFSVGPWVRHETPEESRRMHRPKRYNYNNEDEDNSPNTMTDRNFQVT